MIGERGGDLAMTVVALQVSGKQPDFLWHQLLHGLSGHVKDRQLPCKLVFYAEST